MGLYEDLAQSHRSLRRGQVWCRTCGATRNVDPAECLGKGWPKCCGYTMTIDAPDERPTEKTTVSQEKP